MEVGNDEESRRVSKTKKKRREEEKKTGQHARMFRVSSSTPRRTTRAIDLTKPD